MNEAFSPLPDYQVLQDRMSAPWLYSLNTSSTQSKGTRHILVCVLPKWALQYILNNYLLNYFWENWGTYKSLSDLDNWFALNRCSVSALSWQLSFADLTYSEAVIWLLLIHLLSLQMLLAEKLSGCKIPTEI